MMNQETKQGPFANLGKVKLGNDNVYFQDGRYRCRIQDVKKNISVNPTTIGQVSVIIRLSILKVLVKHTDIITPGLKKTISSNSAGEVCTIHIKMSWGESAERMVAQFIIAGAKIPFEKTTDIGDEEFEELAEMACFRRGSDVEGRDTSEWEDQPFRGADIVVNAQTKATKAGKDFTKITFGVAADEE